MTQMHNPWPDAATAIAMAVEELALRVVDRLDVTTDDPFHSLLRRDSFVNREVTEHEARCRHVDGRATVTTSDEALARHPALARAYSEAWDYSVTQGWLAADPARGGLAYVTQRGQDALTAYRRTDVARAEDAAEAFEEGPSPKDEAEPLVAPTHEPPDERTPAVATPHRGLVRRFLYNVWTVEIGAAVIAGLILLALAFTLPRLLGDDDRAGATTAEQPGAVTTDQSEMVPKPQRFTVQNDVRRGAWALTAPTLPRMYARDERPPGAKRWLPDGTVVSIECAKRATPYAVIVNSKNVQWEWWGRLVDDTWVPLAPLKEALQDGSQGLPACP